MSAPAKYFLIGAFTVSGVLHLAKPTVFEPLIPPSLGDPRPWVLGSGVAELACAAGLATDQAWAPAATAATLAGVWVGNWYMAIAWQRSDRPALAKGAAWVRVPLQVPMIAAALRSGRG